MMLFWCPRLARNQPATAAFIPLAPVMPSTCKRLLVRERYRGTSRAQARQQAAGSNQYRDAFLRVNCASPRGMVRVWLSRAIALVRCDRAVFSKAT